MPGVLYSNNFNGLAGNALLPEFVSPNAANSDFKIEPNGTAGAQCIGANGYGNNNPGYGAVYNAGGALGRQVARFTIRLPDASSSYPGNMTALVMADTAGNHYRALIQCGDSGGGVYKYGFLLSRYEGGNTTLLAPSYTFSPPSGGGFVEIELEGRPSFPSAGSTTLNARMWNNGSAYPSAPTATVIDSNLPRSSGFPGIEHGGAFGWILAGNLVITDGTVSSGVFDPVADTTPPTVIAASVANGTPTVVALTMSEAMDTTSVPDASAFTVAGHTVSAVGIVGNTINLTVTPAFVNGEAARVAAYVQPTTNKARDVAATPNPLASFSNYAITNNVAAAGDTTPPSLSTAQVLNSAPNQIVLTFNETLGAVTPAASAFAVSGGKTVSAVSRSGAQITLTCSATYAYGDNITVTYTKPGTNPIQDAATNQTGSFGPSAVINSIANPGTTTVTFTAAKKLTARADAALAANVAVHAFVHDKLTGALVGSKSGLVTSSAGIPPAFTGTFGLAGTEYDVKFVDDANPRRRSIELITAS